MRVVIDTNVVLSGLYFGGVPGKVLDAWSGGEFELVVSPDILGEYARAGAELGRQYPERQHALTPILALIAAHAVVVEPPPMPVQISDDPDDDIFLAAAHHGGAAIVVSGDRALRRVSGWQGVQVLTPREFIEVMADR